MILLSMIILVAGIVIGSSGTMIIAKRSSPRPFGPTITSAERFVRGLEHMLDLTEEQSEKIKPITESYFEKLDVLRKKNQPLIETIIKDMNKAISNHLTGEQKEMWKSKIEHFQKGFRMHRGRGQGRGPGPHTPGGGRGMGPGGGRGMGPGPGNGMGPGGGGRGPGRGFGPGPEGRRPRSPEDQPPPDHNLPAPLPEIR